MKKILRRLTLAVLVLGMALPVPAGAVTRNEEEEMMIRVGLASTSTHNATGALACAHLQNSTGHGQGFRFGVYDEDLNFVELSRTDEDVDTVAIMKTQNLCYGYDNTQDRTTYSPNVDSDIRVGCYHLQIGDTYDSYEEAAETAEEYDGFVAWIDDEYQVRVGAWFTKDEALEAQEELEEGEVVGTSSYGMSVVELGTDKVLFQFDSGAEARLAIAPDVTEEEDVQAWFRGYKYRGGFTYQRIDGGDLTVVNVLPLEEYVKGVAPYEMGREWPLEALKTQATCARTYAINRMGYHESLGFDVCNSSWCQVYRGTGSSAENYGPTEISDQAVEETAGQVIWYEDTLADTYYSSSFGGASESITNVWGDRQEKFPYLSGIVDPYEETVDDINTYSPWTKTYTTKELTRQLQNSGGYGVGTSVDSLTLTYSRLGNVIKVEVNWANGQKNSFKPDAIRKHFDLRSIRFVVNDTRVVESDVEEEEKLEESETAQVTLPLNETEELVVSEEMYVITGDGELEEAAEKLYTISGKRGKVERLEIPEAEEEEEIPEPGQDPDVDYSGTVTVSDDEYVFEGSGWGHQLGMSQYGANAMAKLGFTFEEIIQHYYPGTNVAEYEE